jgi:hypothetical protein
VAKETKNNKNTRSIKFVVEVCTDKRDVHIKLLWVRSVPVTVRFMSEGMYAGECATFATVTLEHIRRGISVEGISVPSTNKC